MSNLFSPLKLRDCTLKNRIVMSPMCMYSCLDEDGKVTPFHEIHYITRAMGGIGLIILEASAVSEKGRISKNDLGIWDDSQIDGLKKLVGQIHTYGSKVGIQLSHAGRKSRLLETSTAPSSLPHTSESPVPKSLNEEEIADIVLDFQQAAKRAEEAGIDVIELHGAHGYLIHQFLSPVSNKRNDKYGGDLEKRFRFLKEIITAIREVWSHPLFVRIAASEYDENGNSTLTYAKIAKKMDGLGVDLIDCSSGGTQPRKVKFYPGYQTYLSEYIRSTANIRTAAVGLITTGRSAEMILANEAADLIFVGRELLRNPYWAIHVARELQHSIEAPAQYERAWREDVQV